MCTPSGRLSGRGGGLLRYGWTYLNHERGTPRPLLPLGPGLERWRRRRGGRKGFTFSYARGCQTLWRGRAQGLLVPKSHNAHEPYDDGNADAADVAVVDELKAVACAAQLPQNGLVHENTGERRSGKGSDDEGRIIRG